MNSIYDQDKTHLKEYILKLDTHELKLFYSILVHYWVNYKYFISNQNFLNLWCEFNQLCHKADESFPKPYDDHKIVKSYCQAHPFYFIDILSPELVKNLFCQYLDDRLDILANIVKKLHDEDLKAAVAYTNEALGLNEDITELVIQIEEHLAAFS